VALTRAWQPVRMGVGTPLQTHRRQDIDQCRADSADPTLTGDVSQGLHGSTRVLQAVSTGSLNAVLVLQPDQDPRGIFPWPRFCSYLGVPGMAAYVGIEKFADTITIGDRSGFLRG
jgi:hypothetical protein